MWRIAAFCIALMLVAPSVWADPAADCEQDGDQDRVIRGCTELIRQDSGSAAAYNSRGVAYGKKGEVDRAIADFNKAIEIDSQYATAYINRGVTYSAKGEVDRAIADYTKAIQINPKSAEAYYNRGVAYGAKGEVDRAIADYTKAIQINPKSASSYNNRGVAYGAKGEVDRAIADYTKAIQIDPKSADAYANRCQAYSHKKVPDRAITDCTKAIEIDPQFAEAYVNRCEAYHHKKVHDRAITDCTKAIEIDPQSAQAHIVSAYHLRAMGYESKGDLERALMDYDEALRRNPDFLAARAGKILALEAARSACTQVRDRARQVRGCSAIIHFTDKQATPFRAMAHLERGLAYMSQGMRAEAISDLGLAIETEPEPTSARGRELIDRAQKALSTLSRR
jgi:tetratricopeptide (TPR) repeat protein